jgi:hypothetical protein
MNSNIIPNQSNRTDIRRTENIQKSNSGKI